MAQGAQAQLHLPVVPKEGSRTWSWLVEKWEALTCPGKGLGEWEWEWEGQDLSCGESVAVPMCSDSREHPELQGHFCSSLDDGTAAALTPCPLLFPCICPSIHLPQKQPTLSFLPHFHHSLPIFDVSSGCSWMRAVPRGSCPIFQAHSQRDGGSSPPFPSLCQEKKPPASLYNKVTFLLFIQ